MSERLEATPKKQFRRVAAWIYAVINPIIDSLQREVMLLETGNLTWRSASGRCELIKRIQDYVDSRQWPNYYDYQAEHSLFLKTFEQHDSDLALLTRNAKDVYDWLVSWNEFLSAVEDRLKAYESHRAAMGPQFPSFDSSRPELQKMAAENVINNIQSLPSHYLFAPFWNFAARDLLLYRNHSAFVPLQRTTAGLAQISSALKGGLEEHRLKLSREFDVPAAPVPGLSFEA